VIHTAIELYQVFKAKVDMTSSEEWSDELQLCLSRVEIDHTVVVRVVSALDELDVVFADILVDGPIHLLTGGRAVRDPWGSETLVGCRKL
jgi:hypothetical protein